MWLCPVWMSGIIIISKRRQTLTQKVEGEIYKFQLKFPATRKIVKWILKNGHEKMPVWSAKMDEIIQIPTNPLISLRLTTHVTTCLFIYFSFLSNSNEEFKVRKNKHIFEHENFTWKKYKKDHWTLSVFENLKKCILFYRSCLSV